MNDRDTGAQWRKKGYCAGSCLPVDEILAILGDDVVARILVYNTGAERTTTKAGAKEARVGERLGGGWVAEEE